MFKTAAVVRAVNHCIIGTSAAYSTVVGAIYALVEWYQKKP